MTVEQGKVLNEELKHNIKKTMKEKVNVSVKVSESGGTGRAAGEDDTRTDYSIKRAAEPA